jgi:uncharacterized protein YjbJ (UPF0337 family)
MDPNRAAGAIRNGMGKVEQGVGKATGDAKMQAEGLADSIAGKAQNLYGQTKDAASDAAEAIADQAVTLEGFIRDQVRERPYLALGAAFAVGALLAQRWSRH